MKAMGGAGAVQLLDLGERHAGMGVVDVVVPVGQAEPALDCSLLLVVVSSLDRLGA